MEDPEAYAMLATFDVPIKIRLPTTITISGSHHQQIVYIQLSPHSRSILGIAYTYLYQNPLTQTTDLTMPIPQVYHTKGLTC
jgi:hypothetical protein